MGEFTKGLVMTIFWNINDDLRASEIEYTGLFWKHPDGTIFGKWININNDKPYWLSRAKLDTLAGPTDDTIEEGSY